MIKKWKFVYYFPNITFIIRNKYCCEYFTNTWIKKGLFNSIKYTLAPSQTFIDLRGFNAICYQ